MNHRATLLISMIILAIVFLATITLGSMRDHQIMKSTLGLFETQTSAYLKQVTETLRNDLLQQNLRVVRNHLSALRSDSLFSEYAIEQNGVVIDSSSDFEKKVNNPRFLLTDVDVEFTKGQYPLWGHVKYLTSRDELQNISSTLSISLWGLSIFVAFITTVFVAVVSYLFWNSGVFLSRYIYSLLENRPAPQNRFGWWLWRPIAEVIEQIVSEHKSISADLEKTRVERELGRLAAQVAHDIRSPLTALRAVAKLGLESSGSIDLMIRAINRIDEIASDVLLTHRKSKTEDKNLNLREERSPSVNVSKERSEIISLTKLILEEKQLTVNERFKFSLDSTISQITAKIHPSDFQRALSNILNNAVEAMADSEESNIRIFIRDCKDSVLVSVSDSGCGMSSEVLERIGQRGVSFGKDYTDSGNGLGLSYVKACLDRIQGKLSVQSKVGLGSMVSMSIPRYLDHC